MSRRQQRADAPGVDLQEAEAGLKTILDLMAGWREKYGMGYVTAFILPDGSGRIRTSSDAGCEAYGQYPPMEAGGRRKSPKGLGDPVGALNKPANERISESGGNCK